MTWYVHFEYRGLKSTHRVIAETAVFAGKLGAESWGHMNNMHSWQAEKFITEIGKWVTLEEAAAQRDNLGKPATSSDSVSPTA